MRQIWTVARFEFLSFAKSGTFIGMTIFMILFSLIGPALPVIINMFGQSGTERNIAIVDHTGWFDTQAAEASIVPRATFFDDINDARSAVGEGRYNYAVEINGDGYILYVTAMGAGVMHIQQQINDMLRQHYRLNRFYGLGAGPEEIEMILAFEPGAEIMTISWTGEVVTETVDSYLENIVYSYFMSFVLYLGLIIGGQYLLTTVVREKSTKTMELLITSCKAGNMLNGKVLGVCSAVLLQLLLMVGTALFSMSASGILSYGIPDDAFSVNLPFDILGFMIVFFLLGFVMYSYIYAALASTVSRMEDANSIAYLPIMLIMAGFFVSLFGMQNPGAGWVLFFSHIPLFAPFVMFMRVCLGMAAAWEIVVSFTVQVISIGLLAWLGGRIYRMGTLMYGNKPRLKDLLAAFR